MIRSWPKTTAALLAATLLGGCMVGPTYHRPAEALAPFHSQVADARPAAPLDRWWTGFGDPELTRVVERALAQNLDLAASLARVQQARAAARGAGAALLPTVDLQASASAERESVAGPLSQFGAPGTDFRRNQEEYTVGGAASWELDLFGGLRRDRAAARDELAAAEADGVGTRIIVAGDAADAYLQIRGLQARLAVADEQINTDARLVRLVEYRRDHGAAPEREVVQADAVLRQARAVIPTLRTQLEGQLNRLDVLMGVQPGTYAAELAVAAGIPGVPAVGPDMAPADVLRRRPDVIAAERRLAASNERIGAAISDYYPKFSLSGALGVDSLRTGNLFTVKAFQPVGTGLLRWRLFDFGKVDAEVAQARGANAEALALYRAQVLRAAEDVENALVTLRENQNRVVELEAAVTALDRSRLLSEKAYKAGAITLTDVLEADRQLLSARDDLLDTRAGAARAAVLTFRAFGGGWDAGTAPPPSPAPATPAVAATAAPRVSPAS